MRQRVEAKNSARMIEETGEKAFDALLSFGIAGIFSFAFFSIFFHMLHTLTSIQWVFSEHIGDVVTPSKRFSRHLHPPRENSKKQRKNHEFFEIKPPLSP